MTVWGSLPVAFILQVEKPRPGVTHSWGQGPEEQRSEEASPALQPAGPSWEEAGSSVEKRRPWSRRAVLSQPVLSGHVWGAVGREGRELGRPRCSARTMGRASLSGVPAPGGRAGEVRRLPLPRALCAQFLPLITLDPAQDKLALQRACPCTLHVPRHPCVCVCACVFMC